MRLKVMFAYLLVSLAFISCKKIASDTNTTESNKTPQTEHRVVDVRGIDVSHFQGTIPWDTLAKQIQFAFCKATEGETYVDPSFQENWSQIKTAGLFRGAYHFYRSGDDPKAQATFFLQTLGTLASNDLPLVLDIESESLSQPTSHATLQQDLLLFLEVLETQTGKKPILYTNPSFANQYLTDTRFGNYPLWIASYQKNSPIVPDVWSNASWYFWQKTDHYTADNELVDFDLFKGDIQALTAFMEKN